jgi:hypothetical protein
MKNLLRYFNAKVGRKDIFKPTIGNKGLLVISNDKGVREVNFTTSQNFTGKSTMFSHRNIHTFTCKSPNGKNHNQNDNILTDNRMPVYLT